MSLRLRFGYDCGRRLMSGRRGGAYGRGSRTLAGCCKCARQPSKSSLTSLAEAKCLAGFFSKRRWTMPINHGGSSGLRCGQGRRRVVDQPPQRGQRRVGLEGRDAAGHSPRRARSRG